MAKQKQQAAGKGDGLSTRLNGYSAMVGLSGAAQKLRSRAGNWPIYAAAAGSALAMATSASASIISNTLTNVSVEPGGHSTFSIKGLILLAEVNINAQAGPSFSAFQLSAIAPALVFATTAHAQNVKNFGSWDKISNGGAAQPTAIVHAFFSGQSYGNFLPNQPGFAGLAFKTQDGGYNYGWLKLEFTTDSETQIPELEALAYGVDTVVNEPFFAGETAPEPGSLAMAILASGACGVLALRRRRQKSTAVAV